MDHLSPRGCEIVSNILTDFPADIHPSKMEHFSPIIKMYGGVVHGNWITHTGRRAFDVEFKTVASAAVFAESVMADVFEVAPREPVYDFVSTVTVTVKMMMPTDDHAAFHIARCDGCTMCKEV